MGVRMMYLMIKNKATIVSMLAGHKVPQTYDTSIRSPFMLHFILNYWKKVTVMVRIASNSVYTNQLTTQIGQANNELKDIPCAVPATGTTVSGQEKAEESIIESTRLINLFNTALQKDLANLKRTAEAFHQTDELLQFSTDTKGLE